MNRRTGTNHCACADGAALKYHSARANMRARPHDNAPGKSRARSYVYVVADHAVMIDRCSSIDQDVLPQSRRRLNDRPRHHLNTMSQLRGPCHHSGRVNYGDELVSKRGKAVKNRRARAFRIDRANSVRQPDGLSLPCQDGSVGADVRNTQNVRHWLQSGNAFNGQSRAQEGIDHYPRVPACSNDYYGKWAHGSISSSRA